MLYIQQSLGDGEELVHVGEFHWMYTFTAFLNIVFGMIGSILVLVGANYMYKQLGQFPPDLGVIESIPYLHPGLRIFSFIVFFLGLLSFAQKMIIKATTEIAITSKRIVLKRGLVARHIGEISVDRVEGVNVLQGILGRIFNYGRLAVRGMGVGEVIFPPIDDPITFRKAIETARSSATS